MKKIFRMLNNIKMKLVLSFSLLLIIPTVMVGMLAYTTAKKAVDHQILSGFKETLDVVNASIDTTIQPKIHDTSFFSKTLTSQLYKGEGSPELRKKLTQYAGLHPETQSIYVGTKTGLLIQEPKVDMPAGFDPRERDWYKDAIDNQGEAIISDPHITAGTDITVVTISRTISDGSGVVAINLPLTYIQGIINEVKIGDRGYAFLLDEHSNFIAHPTDEGNKAKDAFFQEMYKQEQGQIHYVFKGKDKRMAFMTNELTGWKLAGTVEDAELSEAATPILNKTGLVIMIAMIIGAIVIFFIIKSIIKPLKELKETAITVSRGDLTQSITIQSNDEIGQVGQAFNEMQEHLRVLVQEVEQNAEQVAASAEQLTASAEQTNTATEYVAASIQEVAGNAEKQTIEVDKNAQSLHEVSEGVTRIANYSMKVSDLSYLAATQAEEGGQAVTNTVNQMNSIHESIMESNIMIQSLNGRSKEIRSILDVITGIADQTNLLSLNAAIEAARAGEHGKGFAVVADEVRKLAEQSQQSAKEIYEIVRHIQGDTENSVQIMARVTKDVQAGVQVSHAAIDKFNQILQSTKEITPQIEDVSATAQQMSAAIQEVTALATELAVIARGNATTSEEVAASSEEQLASMEEISTSAQSLSSMAGKLKELISKFTY